MKKLASLAVLLLAVPMAQATPIFLDTFSVNEGHFNVQPTFSGSTTGILLTSTADRITTDYMHGPGSQKLVLLNDPAHVAAGWNVRHLSGTGSIANNVPIPVAGYTGYWLKTSTPNLQTMPVIDDGAAGGTERGVPQPIIADGLWHRYDWKLTDPAQWNAWVGASDGDLDGPTVTYDSIWILSTVDQDAEVLLDSVFYPEPASLALLALGGMVAIRRRRS